MMLPRLLPRLARSAPRVVAGPMVQPARLASLRPLLNSGPIATRSFATSPARANARPAGSDGEKGNFTPPPPPPPQEAQRRYLLWLTLTFLALPLALETVGLIDLYFLFGSPWPKSVRSNLREAARAERKGDFATAELFYALAEEAARKAAADKGFFTRLGSSPAEILAKLSAIAVGRGAALEASGRYPEAFKTYTAAFDELTRAGPLSGETPSPQDEARAVTLAKKLGDLASSGKFVLPAPGTKEDGTPQLTDMDALADEYYRWAVQHMLPLALPPDVHGARVTAASGGQGVGAEGPEPPKAAQPLDVKADTVVTEGQAHQRAHKHTAYGPLQHLSVPEWAQSTDLGNALEALAAFYSARNHPERAAQLYNHAISLLRSPVPETQGSSPILPVVTDPQTGVAPPVGLLPGLDTGTKCHAGVLFYKLVHVLLSAGARPWKEQGNTEQEAQLRQENVRARAVAVARDGLALVRATEAEVGVPPSPDPVTTIGRGSVAPLSTPTVPTKAAPLVSVETLDECKLAEAGLLFALGRAVASQGGDTNQQVTGLYKAAEDAARPIASRAPLTHEHVVSITPPQDPIAHGTRDAASTLLSEIAQAQANLAQ